MKAAILVVVLLAGCATMDHQSINDWPALAITEHVVSATDMLVKCYPTIPVFQKLLGAIPLACAWVDFERRRCDIYVTSWASAGVLAHERLHCAGYDHDGETTLRDALARWRAR